MPRLPKTLARSLTVRCSFTRRKEVGRWWADLPRAEKRGLRKLLPEDRGALPIVTVPLLARFVDPAGSNTEEETTDDDLYEWIVGHELEFFQPRMIHICSAHPAARAAVDDGVLAADFTCPARDTACPMRALLALAPAHDVVFSADVLPSRCP